MALSKAVRGGIADFGERLRIDHNLKEIPTYTWQSHGSGNPVMGIYPLNSDNIDEWIAMARDDMNGFRREQVGVRYDEEVPPWRLSEMVNYALNIAANRDTSARIDAQAAQAAQAAQEAQATSNVSKQMERNAVAFMTHDQLIEALEKMGINKDSSLITSSSSDTELRNVLWNKIGHLYGRGGRRRKTKKSKRRRRKTRRRHK